MPTSQPRRNTYADLMELPEHITGELIDGQLHAYPRPAPKYIWASSHLGAELVGPYQKHHAGREGWWILDRPELHLNGNVLVPDLAGWRRERLPKLPETAWFDFAPDWVCEVLSPSTARLDRSEKMPLYAAAGVSHLWLIDPDPRTLEVYQRQTDGHWLLLTTLADAAEVCQPPFDATTFDLTVLWPDE